MSVHDVLDRPVWHALTGRQVALAIGGQDALRFDPQYGPFAATADVSKAGLDGLASLAGKGEIWLVEREEIVPPPGLAILKSAPCLQMIATSITPDSGAPDFRDLGDDDAQDMFDLAMLTAPGPFARSTHRLGGFIGIKAHGRLIAMAGERMKPGNFTEVSGVCTHPDYRGRGFAASLMRQVARRILARGEMPFLHSYASNAGAISLYESLGFTAHQTVIATVLKRPS